MPRDSARAPVLALAVAFAAACSAVSVCAEGLSDGDPARGKALVEKSCVTCHATLFGGDASKMYLRPDRKVKDAAQLVARVKTCNVNTGAGWNAADELNAAAYLNQTYYRYR